MIKRNDGIPIILKYDAIKVYGVVYEEFEIQATLYPDDMVKIEYDQQKKIWASYPPGIWTEIAHKTDYGFRMERVYEPIVDRKTGLADALEYVTEELKILYFWREKCEARIVRAEAEAIVQAQKKKDRSTT
jgi:hypothetical protein